MNLKGCAFERKEWILTVEIHRSIANKPAPLMNDRDIDESEIQMESDNLSNEASTSSVIATTSTSHLLDPSLFAASFAKKKNSKTLTSNGKTKVLSSHTSTSKLPTKKRFGLVKGRDGQPMKKLKDGRTIVRVLPKPTQKMDLQVENQAREETLLRPSVLDPSEVLPNAKIRAFRKHKLGLKERKSEASSKPNKSNFEEDPLGLEDPAFMKGGELEGVGLSLSKKQTAKSRPVIQRKGGRTKCEKKIW